MGNLMMRWNRKASGSRLLETETPKNSRCLPVTPRSKLGSRCKGLMPRGAPPAAGGPADAMDGRRNAAAFAVFTACESAAIREPASAGRPLAAAGGGTMGTGF